MDLCWMLTAGAGVAAASYALTWGARWAAPRLGWIDRPDGGRKSHARVTPLLGGAAIYLAFLGAVAVSSQSADLSEFPLAGLLASATLFCALGLWDDRRPLKAREKFLLQILASLPFAVASPTVDAVQILGWQFYLGPLGLPFAVFWLVACANIVNLVDGLDGLASTFGLIAVSTLAAMAGLTDRTGVALVAVLFAGGILGFLIHNWPPARIFLGDAGSLMIGFVVGALSLQASLKSTAGFMLGFPIVILSVPILDTSMAILRRKLTGRGIGEADRRHIHHLLQDRGLSKLQTLLVIGALSTAMAVATVAASMLGADWVAVAICLVVVSLIIAGRVFGFHEMTLVFRHLEIIHALLGDARHGFKSRRLVVHWEHHDQIAADDLWTLVCVRVAAAGALVLKFQCESSEGGVAVTSRSWSRPPEQASPAAASLKTTDYVDALPSLEDNLWQLQYSVPREDGLTASFFVSGQVSKHQPRLDQLLRVLDGCGRHWPATPVQAPRHPRRAA